MKRILLILTMIVSLGACKGQVPAIGGMITAPSSGNNGVQTWDITVLYYSGITKSIPTDPSSVFFTSDGTTIYTMQYYSNSDWIRQWTLSTPWDITTATYVRYLSVNSNSTTPMDLYFSPDGANMYVLDMAMKLHRWTLSTPWNISTTTYQNYTDLSTYANVLARSIWFSPDGVNLYYSNTTDDNIRQFSLSIPWDITSISLLETVATDQYFMGIQLSDDGYSLIGVEGSSTGLISEYRLSTAWDITSMSYIQSVSISSQDTYAMDIFVDSDCSNIWIVGSTYDLLYHYTK